MIHATLGPIARALLPQRQSGHCDTCGRWDSDLVAGIGRCCRLTVAHSVTTAQRRAVHERLIRHLKDVPRAVMTLVDAGCRVRGVRFGQHAVTIELLSAPPEGVVCSQARIVRKGQWITRGKVGEATVEWASAGPALA